MFPPVIWDKGRLKLVFSQVSPTRGTVLLRLRDHGHQEVRAIFPAGVYRVSAFVHEFVVAPEKVIFHSVLAGYVHSHLLAGMKHSAGGPYCYVTGDYPAWTLPSGRVRLD